MTKFQIVTRDQDPIDVVASDPATILQIADRRQLDAGDVYREGHYLFSFSCSNGGCWLIEGRSGQPLITRHPPEARQHPIPVVPVPGQ